MSILRSGFLKASQADSKLFFLISFAFFFLMFLWLFSDILIRVKIEKKKNFLSLYFIILSGGFIAIVV